MVLIIEKYHCFISNSIFLWKNTNEIKILYHIIEGIYKHFPLENCSIEK